MGRVKAAMTVGPASRHSEVLKPVIEQRLMSIARNNCSHAVNPEHYAELAETTARIRTIAAACDNHVDVFYDTPGHKIRVSGFNDPIPLEKGQVITFTDPDSVTPGIVCNQPGYLGLGKEGGTLYTGDGGADDPEFSIMGKGAGWLECQVVSGNLLHPRKGLTIAGANVSSLDLSALTDHDLTAMKAGIAVGADYLGMSYGTKATQFREFIDTAKRLGAKPGTKYVFKYELDGAGEELANIVDLADVMYYGQGDMNLSVNFLDLIRHRRRVLEACRAAGKDSWVGTGLLMSLVKGRIPKPGEIAGLLQVLKEGPTALVLSDEFNIGKHPFLAALILNQTIDFSYSDV